jgi:hypothetical protein
MSCFLLIQYVSREQVKQRIDISVKQGKCCGLTFFWIVNPNAWPLRISRAIKLYGTAIDAYVDAAPGRLGAVFRRQYARIPPLPSRFTNRMSNIVDTRWFEGVAVTTIVGNAIVLGMPYEGMSGAYAAGLEIANIVFTVLFAVEVMLRMLAVGAAQYFSVKFNIFDSAVAALSMLDVLMMAASGTSTAGGAYNALRAIRVIRVIRITRISLRLRLAIENLARAIPAAINAMILLVVVMLVFAVLGMQLFGDITMWESALAEGTIDAIPRLNFTSLWLAMVTVFEVTDNENWNDTLVSID